MLATTPKTLSRALRASRIRLSPFSLCTIRSLHPGAKVPNRGLVVVAHHKANATVSPSMPSAPESNEITSSNPKQSASPSAVGAPDADLVVTPSCWKRIHLLAKRRNLPLEDVYLRVYVDAGGCSGFSYKFELDDSPLEEEEDVVFSNPDSAARLVIDAASLDLMRGSTIDYVEEMIKSSFEVRNNPQSESACGCGSSFALKNFAANPAVD